MQLLKILFLVQVTAIGSSEYYNYANFSLRLFAWKDILLGYRKLRSEKLVLIKFLINIIFFDDIFND